MEGKSISETKVITSHIMLPQDANPYGNIHGGVIIKHIDNAAAVVATRHSRCNVVTVSIDRLNFYHPGHIGDLLILEARLNWVGRSSMEIGVRAEMEELLTGQTRHVASAYLTFVALDENGRACAVPPLILKTENEVRRHKEAQERRKGKAAEKDHR